MKMHLMWLLLGNEYSSSVYNSDSLKGSLVKLRQRKSKDRPARTPNVVFVVASHYQSLKITVLLLQACL